MNATVAVTYSDNSTGNIVVALATSLGLKPEDIDVVMCTHLHFDHVGWNTRLENGKWVPTFPKARYLIGKQEYAHWSKEGDAEQLEILDDFLTGNALKARRDHEDLWRSVERDRRELAEETGYGGGEAFDEVAFDVIEHMIAETRVGAGDDAFAVDEQDQLGAAPGHLRHQHAIDAGSG